MALDVEGINEGFVLVQPVVPDTKTAGGLYVPDSAASSGNIAKVIACDPDTGYSEGDIVAHLPQRELSADGSRFTDTSIRMKIRGVDVMVLHKDDIICSWRE